MENGNKEVDINNNKNNYDDSSDEEFESEEKEDDDDDEEEEIDSDLETMLTEEAKLWKSEIDETTNREYWYHIETLETQWRKPMCLASRKERKAIAEKERQQREFFASMEANILRSMIVSTTTTTTVNQETESESKIPEEDNDFEDDEDDNTNNNNNNDKDNDKDDHMKFRRSMLGRQSSFARLSFARTTTVTSRRLSFDPDKESSSSFSSSLNSSVGGGIMLSSSSHHSNTGRTTNANRFSFGGGSGGGDHNSRNSTLIRTISTMEDSVLKSLIKRVPSIRGILRQPKTEWSSRGSKNTDESQQRVRFGGVKFAPPTILTDPSTRSLDNISENAVYNDDEEEDDDTPVQQLVRQAAGRLDISRTASDSSNEDNPTGQLLTRQVGGRLKLQRSSDDEDDNTSNNNFHGRVNREDSVKLTMQRGSNHGRTNKRTSRINREDSLTLNMLKGGGSTHSATNDNSMSLSTMGGGDVLGGIGGMSGFGNMNSNFNSNLGSGGSLDFGGGEFGDGDNNSDYFADLNESKFCGFDMSDEELLAIDQLAEITNEMTNVDEEDDEFDIDVFNKATSHDLQVVDERLEDEEDSADSDGGSVNASESNDKVEQSEIQWLPTKKNNEDNETEIVLIDSTTKRTETMSELLRENRTQIKLKEKQQALLTSDASDGADLKRRARSFRTVKQPATATGIYSSVGTQQQQQEQRMLDFKKPGLIRRNTLAALDTGRETTAGKEGGGTSPAKSFVGSTLSAPDKDATIKCVCGVFRAHILQSGQIDKEVFFTDEDDDDEDDNNQNKTVLDEYLSKYSVFNDLQQTEQQQQLPVVSSRVPKLEDITTFYRDVFHRAAMETDCIIMSLIYVERLIKNTNGLVRPRPCNWRSLLFSCMVLSSKVHDDLSMWNNDFSQTCPAGVHFSLQRVNQLEIAVLQALEYHVKVLSSEYAKYYFLLRSMLIKSGLGSEDVITTNPLDVEGARRLQHLSSQYEKQASIRILRA